MNQPPYNPQAPPYPQQGGNVGFEHYQEGAPPPYNAGPTPYPQQHYGGPPGHGPGHGPDHGPGHGPGAPGPYGSAAHYPAGQQPQTVYVYEDRRRQQQKQEDDTCLAMLAGACAMCLCCSLLSD